MKLLRQGLKRNRGEKILFYKENIKATHCGNYATIHTSGKAMSEGGSGVSETTHFFTLELSNEDIANIIGSLEIRDKKTKKLNASLRKALLDKKEIIIQLLMLTSDFLDDDCHEKQ